jgi:hypothetical protein
MVSSLRKKIAALRKERFENSGYMPSVDGQMTRF